MGFNRSLAIAAALVVGAVAGTGPYLQAAAAGATNPGFESGVSGWAPLAGTKLTLTQTEPHGGQNAAALSRVSRTGAAGVTDAPEQFSQLPGGSTCTAGAWVRGPVGHKAKVTWTALSGTTTVSTTARTLLFNGSWQELLPATLVLPAQASTADLQFSAPAFPLGETWYLDDVTASCGGSAAPAPAPAPSPSASGYAGRWLLNETGSPVTAPASDASGNNNHGTNYNVQGNGQAYTFNGVDSRVVVPDSDTLDPGVADFSFGVSMSMSQAPAVGETYDVLRKGLTTSAGGDYKIEVVNSNGKALVKCLVKDAQKVVASIRAAKSLADNRQHDISCRIAGNSLTITVDGVNAGTKTVTTLGSVSNAANVAIGAKAEGTAATGFDWYLGTVGEAWVQRS